MIHWSINQSFSGFFAPLAPEYCDSMSVCVFLCLSGSISPELHVQSLPDFLCMLSIVAAWSFPGSIIDSVVFAHNICTLSFSALTLLVGQQEGHPARKKHEWWGTGMVICLERDADLHMAQLTPLPLTVSCFSKIQIGFTFLVPAYPGSPRQRAVKWVCVC